MRRRHARATQSASVSSSSMQALFVCSLAALALFSFSGSEIENSAGDAVHVVQLLDSTGYAHVIASALPALVRFDPPDCETCSTMAFFWETQVAKRWPHKTFHVNCSQQPALCVTRRVGSEPSAKRPVFARPDTRPSIQAWAGSRGWLRYNGQSGDTSSLLAFCQAAISPTRSSRASSSAKANSSPTPPEGARLLPTEASHQSSPRIRGSLSARRFNSVGIVEGLGHIEQITISGLDP